MLTVEEVEKLAKETGRTSLNFNNRRLEETGKWDSLWEKLGAELLSVTTLVGTTLEKHEVLNLLIA